MELLLRPGQTDRQREKGSMWSFLKWIFFFLKNIGCAVSRQQGNSFLAPEEIPHLAAIEKLESGFIYKMTYGWLLCTCHKRLNNNSFHVHYTGFSSANSTRGLLKCQKDGFRWGTGRHCTVFDLIAVSKLQRCCHVRVLSLTACTDYWTWRHRKR